MYTRIHWTTLVYTYTLEAYSYKKLHTIHFKINEEGNLLRLQIPYDARRGDISSCLHPFQSIKNWTDLTVYLSKKIIRKKLINK